VHRRRRVSLSQECGREKNESDSTFLEKLLENNTPDWNSCTFPSCRTLLSVVRLEHVRKIWYLQNLQVICLAILCCLQRFLSNSLRKPSLFLNSSFGAGKYGWDFTGNANLQELHAILQQQFMIRRLKKDVLKYIIDALMEFV